jgi:ribose/xylose/arabinose/galactoside ABC-type transport system permease subunit
MRPGLVAVIVLLVLLYVLGAVVSDRFNTAGNLLNVYEQSTALALVSLGQALVIIIRGLDLSVGSVMATSAVIATGFGGRNTDVLIIVAASLLMGLGAGLLNGVLVTKRSVSPFLAATPTRMAPRPATCRRGSG